MADSTDFKSESQLIDETICELSDRRGEKLAKLRSFINEADPDVVEVVKWRKPSNSMRDVPVWSHDSKVWTGEPYKDKVMFTFAKGASIGHPAGLLISGLEGKVRRAIDFREEDEIDDGMFKQLIQDAATLKGSSI